MKNTVSLKRLLVFHAVLLSTAFLLIALVATPWGARQVVSWIGLPFACDRVSGNLLHGLVLHNAHQDTLWHVDRATLQIAWPETLKGQLTFRTLHLHGLDITSSWAHLLSGMNAAPPKNTRSRLSWQVLELTLDQVLASFDEQPMLTITHAQVPLSFDGRDLHVGPGHVRAPRWSLTIFDQSAQLHHHHAGALALRWGRDAQDALSFEAKSSAWWGNTLALSYQQQEQGATWLLQQPNNQITLHHTPEGGQGVVVLNALDALWPYWQGRLKADVHWAQDNSTVHVLADDLNLWSSWGGLTHLDLSAQKDEQIALQWDADWGAYHLKGAAQQRDKGDWLLAEASLAHQDTLMLLQAPTRFDPQAQSIAPHCWRDVSGAGVCLHYTPEAWRVEADRFPVALSGKWHDTAFSLDGLLDSQLEYQHPGRDKTLGLLGRWDLHRNQGLIVHQNVQSSWEQQHLWFEASPTQWQLSFQDAKHASPALLWQRDLKNNTHHLRWTDLDLSSLHLETPWTQTLHGVSQGSLSGPWLELPNDGTAHVTQASWHWPQANTSTLISQADLSLHNKTLTLAAQGHWGGPFEAEAVLHNTSEGWQGPISFSGEELAPLNNKQYHAILDAHGTLQWGQDTLDLEATVREASLKPQWRPTLSPSSDLRFTRDDFVLAHTTPPHLPFTCLLHLSNQVHVQAYGLSSMISGQLALDARESAGVLAEGTLVLREGHYDAYGQRFVLDQGRLSFEGGPISNPSVRLRATRNLPATDQHDGITAGLELSGLLNQPTIALFSNPSMPDHDIVSYLLWDQPSQSTEQHQGDALLALTQGWLSDLGQTQWPQGLSVAIERNPPSGNEDQPEEPPLAYDLSMIFKQQWSERLFISYQMGLMHPSRSVRFEYALNPHLRLSAESSTEHSGADLAWQFAVGSRPQPHRPN